MFAIRNEADKAEVYLYGRIGKSFWGDGNSAKGFIDQLKDLSPKPLDIHIDSGGGDVFEGFAICSAIQRYEGPTVAYVDGMACSAASYIAAMCDEVRMNDFAFLMIHNASAMAAGTAEELEKTVALLRNIDDTLTRVYVARSDMDEAEVRDAMAAETWYTADEAKEKGLCQEVIVTEARLAACVDDVTASEYRNMPQAVSVRKGWEPSTSQTPNTIPEAGGAKPADLIAMDGKLISRKDA